jgi:hypothetical protein
MQTGLAEPLNWPVVLFDQCVLLLLALQPCELVMALGLLVVWLQF